MVFSLRIRKRSQIPVESLLLNKTRLYQKSIMSESRANKGLGYFKYVAPIEHLGDYSHKVLR